VVRNPSLPASTSVELHTTKHRGSLQQVAWQTDPAGQSELFEHTWFVQFVGWVQKLSPLGSPFVTFWLQKHPCPHSVWPLQEPTPAGNWHAPVGADAANAGVVKLLTTGVTHTTAPVMPILLSIFLRDTDASSERVFSSMADLPPIGDSPAVCIGVHGHRTARLPYLVPAGAVGFVRRSGPATTQEPGCAGRTVDDAPRGLIEDAEGG
jgi:hypothetical protein